MRFGRLVCVSNICEIADWGEEQVSCAAHRENNYHIPVRTNISINDYLPKFIAKRIVCERSITWEKRNRLMEIRRQRNALAFGPTFLSKNKYYRRITYNNSNERRAIDVLDVISHIFALL